MKQFRLDITENETGAKKSYDIFYDKGINMEDITSMVIEDGQDKIFVEFLK